MKYLHLMQDVRKRDGKIYVLKADRPFEQLGLSKRFVKLVRIFHVKYDDENPDYEDSQGIGLKFTTDDGLKDFNTPGYTTPRTTNINAVTDPECLIKEGFGDRVVNLQATLASVQPPEPTTETIELPPEPTESEPDAGG